MKQIRARNIAADRARPGATVGVPGIGLNELAAQCHVAAPAAVKAAVPKCNTSSLSECQLPRFVVRSGNNQSVGFSIDRVPGPMDMWIIMFAVGVQCSCQSGKQDWAPIVSLKPVQYQCPWSPYQSVTCCTACPLRRRFSLLPSSTNPLSL